MMDMDDWFEQGYDDAMHGVWWPAIASPDDREEYVKGWEVGNMDYWQYATDQP